MEARLGEFLPAEASRGNPVDMLATASGDDYRRTLRLLLDADVADAIIAIFVPPLVTRGTDVAAAIREVAEATEDVPICTVFMTGCGPPTEVCADGLAVPAFEFPEDAARAVALAARHGRWRARGEGATWESTHARPERAAAIISDEFGRGGGWLSPATSIALLSCYGLPLIETRVVADADGATAAAAELGTPVALDANVRRAGARPDGLIVQKMAPSGIELIVGMVHDPSFGPVLACGPGAKTTGVMKDIAVRIIPVTDLDAGEMLRSLQSFPILDGTAGGTHHDVAAVEQLLMGVGALVDAHPEIAERDINPVIATPDRALIVDAQVRVQDAPPPSPMPSLDA